MQHRWFMHDIDADTARVCADSLHGVHMDRAMRPLAPLCAATLNATVLHFMQVERCGTREAIVAVCL
jgi:hypothetical protein